MKGLGGWGHCWRQVSFLLLDAQTLQVLTVSTGYVLLSELSSNWQLLSTELFTEPHLGTCLIS